MTTQVWQEEPRPGDLVIQTQGAGKYESPLLPSREEPVRDRQTDGEHHRTDEAGMTSVQQQHTDLECAVEMLVKNFEKYAGGGGCCCRKQPRRISKKDFRKMLTRELNHMLTDTGNKRAADKLICDLDENKDGRISFEEYWTLIGGIASPIASLIRQQEQSIKFSK
ncbi:PREDICTED: protein S100-A16 [Crocodylus porosus]|uniref:protein S100-A16 n=1 Tax=Crocodylus porosus TaxID=8502 RepID=UPI00094035AA|nr:PREDICTED: protein S100-A16 [Crocodylus porosus]